MAVNPTWLVDLINKHNDQNDSTEIMNIQSASMVNIDMSRIYNPDKLRYPPINIDGDDFYVIQVFEPAFGRSQVQLITLRTGINNIDMVNYFDE